MLSADIISPGFLVVIVIFNYCITYFKFLY